MEKNKTHDHKSVGGLSEKKNEEAIVNMVMTITIKSKPHEEVAYQEKEPFKGRTPRIGKRKRSSSN
jgi:hypothetical protein